MNGRRGLVLDANILIRAVFGRRGREILEFYDALRQLLRPTFACRLKLFTKDAVSCAVEFQRITLSVVISCD